MFILPIFIIIVLALCLHEIIQIITHNEISIPNSIFAAMCLVIASLFVFGALGLLNAGLVFIWILSGAAGIALIAITVINKNYKKLLKDITSPAMVILIFSCVVYFLVSKTKVFTYRDTATVWGYAARYMYLTGSVIKLEHPSGMAFLNYFFLKTSYYSEGIMFLGRWFFMWVCVLLPFRDNKKEDLWKLAIYAVGAYAVMNIINESQVLYMDTPIGILTGSLFGYFLVNKNKGLKEIVTVLLGMGIVLLIKDEIGKIFAFFLSAFVIIELLMEFLKKETKLNTAQFVISECAAAVFMIPVFTLLLSDGVMDNFKNLIQAKYIIAAVFALAAAAVLVILGVRFYKKSKFALKKDSEPAKNIRYYLIVLAAFAVAVAVYKGISIYYSSLIYEDQNIFASAVRQLFIKGYGGKRLFVAVGCAMLLFIIAYKYMLNKPERKVAARQGLLILMFLLAYIFLLAVMYSKHIIGGSLAAELVQLNRYLGAGVIAVIVWYIVFAFYDALWVNRKMQLIVIALIMSMLITEIPMPTTKMFSDRNYNMNLALTYTYRPEVKRNADFVKANAGADANVFVVTQPGKWSLEDEGAWMEYEMLPLKSYANAVYYGEKVFTGTLNSLGLDEDGFIEMVKQEGYTHVYIYYADEVFIKDFGELFQLKGTEGEGILYEVREDKFIEIGRIKN